MNKSHHPVHISASFFLFFINPQTSARQTALPTHRGLPLALWHHGKAACGPHSGRTSRITCAAAPLIARAFRKNSALKTGTSSYTGSTSAPPSGAPSIPQTPARAHTCPHTSQDTSRSRYWVRDADPVPECKYSPLAVQVIKREWFFLSGLNQQAAVDSFFLPVFCAEDPRAVGTSTGLHDNSLMSCLSTGCVCAQANFSPGVCLSFRPGFCFFVPD